MGGYENVRSVLMLKLAMGIFYSFVVFFFICNIVLAYLYRVRSKTPSFKWLILYLVNFFIYGFSNLIVYYRIHIMIADNILTLLSVVREISYLLIFVLWVEYLVNSRENSLETDRSRKSWQYIFFLIISILCLISWTGDSLFFMSNDYNVINFAGNVTGDILEVILGIIFFIVARYYMKNNVRSLTNILNSAVHIIFLCFITVQDFNVSFANFNVKAQASAMWLICPFFCASVNGIIFVFLFNSVERMLHDPLSDGSKNPQAMSFDELQRRYGITQREKDVIRLMCLGKTNQEIADDLNISENTVKKHAGNIYRKASVESRAELMEIIDNR